MSKPGIEWRRGLAEVVIIVVGVLIALAVDSWNDARLDRALEREYLQGLAADLSQDQAELDEATARSLAFQSAAETLDDLIRSSGELSAPPDSLASWIAAAGFIYFPSYSSHTFDDLTSTGNLRILRDGELRRELLRYQSQIKSTEQWHDRYRWIQRDYTEVTQGVLGSDLRTRLAEGQPPNATSADARRMMAELRGRSRLVEALESMIWVQVRQRVIHDAMRERAGAVVAALAALGVQTSCTESLGAIPFAECAPGSDEAVER